MVHGFSCCPSCRCFRNGEPTQNLQEPIQGQQPGPRFIPGMRSVPPFSGNNPPRCCTPLADMALAEQPLAMSHLPTKENLKTRGIARGLYGRRPLPPGPYERRTNFLKQGGGLLLVVGRARGLMLTASADRHLLELGSQVSPWKNQLGPSTRFGFGTRGPKTPVVGTPGNA